MVKTIYEINFDLDITYRLVGSDINQNLRGDTLIIDIEVEGEIPEVIVWDYLGINKIIETMNNKTILKYCEENKNLIKTIKDTCGKDSVFTMHHDPTPANIRQLIKQTLKIQNNDFKYIVRIKTKC